MDIGSLDVIKISHKFSLYLEQQPPIEIDEYRKIKFLIIKSTAGQKTVEF
jgi:hypothetical protein